jgi:hypothetical protein
LEARNFDLNEVLSRDFSDEAKENQKNSVDISKISAKIRTNHFPDIIVQLYYYDNPLSRKRDKTYGLLLDK